MKTDSAHTFWDAEWNNSDPTSKWARAEPEVLDHATTLPKGAHVLDLGAGIGRHTLAFAAMGMAVSALDASENSVKLVAANAQGEGLDVAVKLGSMTELPFPDGSFDHVLSWNVIYHGDQDVVARTMAEVHRVLRPGGSFMATMLSARRLPVEQAKAKGYEVSPGCWIFDGEGDKIHPHYFCDAKQLVALLHGFELIKLQDKEHDSPGSWHWHFLAERL